MAKDPVCGMEVTDESISFEYNCKKYLFCAEACKKEFEKDPSKYIKEEEKKGGCCC